MGVYNGTNRLYLRRYPVEVRFGENVTDNTIPSIGIATEYQVPDKSIRTQVFIFVETLSLPSKYFLERRYGNGINQGVRLYIPKQIPDEGLEEPIGTINHVRRPDFFFKKGIRDFFRKLDNHLIESDRWHIKANLENCPITMTRSCFTAFIRNCIEDYHLSFEYVDTLISILTNAAKHQIMQIKINDYYVEIVPDEQLPYFFYAKCYAGSDTTVALTLTNQARVYTKDNPIPIVIQRGVESVMTDNIDLNPLYASRYTVSTTE